MATTLLKYFSGSESCKGGVVVYVPINAHGALACENSWSVFIVPYTPEELAAED